MAGTFAVYSVLFTPSFKYFLFAHGPVYIFGTMAYDLMLSYGMPESVNECYQIEKQNISDKIIENVMYRFGMALVIGAVAWLLIHRDLMMFYQRQEQKELKEQHELVLEAQRDIVILVRHPKPDQESELSASEDSLRSSDLGRLTVDPENTMRSPEHGIEGQNSILQTKSKQVGS